MFFQKRLYLAEMPNSFAVTPTLRGVGVYSPLPSSESPVTLIREEVRKQAIAWLMKYILHVLAFNKSSEGHR